MVLIIAVSAQAKDYKKTEDIINIILSEKYESIPSESGNENRAKAGSGTEKDRDTVKRTSQPSALDPAHILLKNGITFYTSGMPDNALQQFQELQKTFPQSPYIDQSRIWTAKIRISRYEYSKAIDTLSKISKESGEYPSALFYSAEAYSFTGDMIKSVSLYQQVASLFPADPRADNALLRAGTIYLNNKKGRNALETAINLIKYYRDRETVDDAYYLLGRIFERDETLKDIETSRRVYLLFIKKAASGEEHFRDSPLTRRVREDLNRIEKNYLMIEN